MAVYRLTNDLIFPNPELADSNGLLALGGDLSAKRLILAYSCGVFPWYSSSDPILWWSPDPRCILFTNNLHISKSMNKFIRKNIYTVTFDAAFSDVIGMCRKLRSDDTWITDEMLNAYCSLNKSGLAHSVETWYEGSLVGGLYGVSLGRAFFGESMFSTMENASKVALISLASKVKERGFEFIDCQVYSKHLSSMGASNIPRKEFLLLLKKALRYDTLSGNWSSL